MAAASTRSGPSGHCTSGVVLLRACSRARPRLRRGGNRCLGSILAPLVLAIALSACGGGSGGPVVPNGCAYVTFGNVSDTFSVPLTLPGNASSYEIVSPASQGHVTLTDPLSGEFTYTPKRNARGIDFFQFQAHMGGNVSNVARYKLVFVPRIMPLGDSITWGGPGESNSCPDHAGYRKPLYDSLSSAGYKFDFVGTMPSGKTKGLRDPDHEGHGAWRADQLAAGGGISDDDCIRGGKLADWLGQTRPDVVLLHAGTNDLNANDHTTDPKVEAQDIGDILRTIHDWALNKWPVTVVVARIITNHERDPKDTTLFNNTVFSEVIPSAIANDDVVEVLEADQQNKLNNFERDYLKLENGEIDKLHPSPTGYQRMADVWLGALTRENVLPKCP